jgi:cardiolipin synthase
MTFRHVVTSWMSIAAAIGLTATGCGTAQSTLPGGSDTHQVTTVGAFTLVQEPEAGFEPIRDMIAGAKTSVRMTLYELTSDDIVDALVAAHARGVQTQVLLDSAFHGQAVNTAAFQRLSSGGVDVHWGPRTTIVHQKTTTIDDARAAIGTGNLIAKYQASSRDASVLDADPDDVGAIVATFSQDFTTHGRPAQAVPGQHLVCSPAARQVVLKRIEAARHTLDVTSE